MSVAFLFIAGEESKMLILTKEKQSLYLLPINQYIKHKECQSSVRSSKLWQSDALLPVLCDMQSKNEFGIFSVLGTNTGLLHCTVHKPALLSLSCTPAMVLYGWRMRFHDKGKLHEIQNLPGLPDIIFLFYSLDPTSFLLQFFILLLSSKS